MIESLEIIQPPKINPKVFYVDKYDDWCEKHFRIIKIVSLRRLLGKKY